MLPEFDFRTNVYVKTVRNHRIRLDWCAVSGRTYPGTLDRTLHQTFELLGKVSQIKPSTFQDLLKGELKLGQRE